MDGVSQADINTLGGKTAENRGRRGDYPEGFDPESPFEDGKLSDNWAKRERYGEQKLTETNNDSYDRSVRSLNNSESYEFSGESEYSRERSDPFEMVDFMIDHGLDLHNLGPKAHSLSDNHIWENVCEILARDMHVDAGQMEVEVNEGVVTLKGHVDSLQIKRMAELSVENLPGVNNVINQLSFR